MSVRLASETTQMGCVTSSYPPFHFVASPSDVGISGVDFLDVQALRMRNRVTRAAAVSAASRAAGTADRKDGLNPGVDLMPNAALVLLPQKWHQIIYTWSSLFMRSPPDMARSVTVEAL